MVRAFVGGLLPGAALAVAYALTAPVQCSRCGFRLGGGRAGERDAARGRIPAALFAEPARWEKVFLYLAIGVLAALTCYFAERKPGLVLGALLFFQDLWRAWRRG